MAWRLANSLTTLRNQVNAAYPSRSKISDGTIGDAAHAASASDHNPNRNGVVCALDLTHDPAHGFDAHALAEHLRINRHPNLRYVISNARIAGAWTNWQWSPSSGHTQHVHISVGDLNVGDGQTTGRYDDTSPWNINYKGDAEVKIGREDNWYWRFNRFHHQLVRNADLPRPVFDSIVGADAWKIVESWSDHPEANQLLHWQVVGERAAKDGWDKQIYALQDALNIANANVLKAQAQLSESVSKVELTAAKEALAVAVADSKLAREELNARLAKETETDAQVNSWLRALWTKITGGK